MAHFARIGSDNKVQEIIVVNNDVLLDENGGESEALGQAFIASLGLNGDWVQCSYNGNIRGGYPAIGWTYNQALDGFISPQPFSSWLFNEETLGWDAPVSMPSEGGPFVWDETLLDWVEVSGV